MGALVRRSRYLVLLAGGALVSCGGGGDRSEFFARDFQPRSVVVVGGPRQITEHSVTGSASSSRFAVAYRGRESGRRFVYAQEFGARAEHVGTLLEVDETDFESTPAIAMNDRGGFIVAWSTRNDQTAFLRMGGDSGSASFQVSRSSGYLWDAAHSADGAAIVIFQRYPPSGYDVAGTWITPEAEVQSEFTVGASYEQSFPAAVRLLDDGSAAIAWNESPDQLMLGRFDRSGHLIRGPVQISQDAAESPRLAVAGSNLVVVFVEPTYEDIGDHLVVRDFNVGARLFSRDLRPLTDRFLVNTRTEGHQRFPTVSTAGDGSFVVTWQQGYGYVRAIEGISGRRFLRDGTAVGDEFEVPAGRNSPSAEPRPSVAVTGDDSFVVVWRQFLGNENRIVAQPFVAD